MVSDYNNNRDYSRFRPIGYPVRHRRKVPFRPELTMVMETRARIRRIREIDERLNGFILSASDYLDLVNDAYASNVHWSTKIEGNPMTYEDVWKLTSEFTKGKARESPNGPVQEILNHLHFLFSDTNLCLPWDVSTILSVHRLLMDGVGQATPGSLRTGDVSVVDPSGSELFIACPHQSVREELESLVSWVKTSPFDEVVTSTLFFHEFESIHPFEDGNGRTGRTLFQILLQELGLRNCMLCKFEEKLLTRSHDYYGLLGFTDQTQSYTQLVDYVTDALLESYVEAESVFSSKDRLKDMDENTRLLAVNAKRVKEFSFQEAASWVKLGESSVRGRLDELTEMGILTKSGRTRSMRYTFDDPLRQVREMMDAGNVTLR